MILPTNTCSSTANWLNLSVQVEVPAVRWPWLVLISLVALAASLVFLAQRRGGWVALITATMLAATVVAAMMAELPNWEVLAVVPEARLAAQGLIAARDLGLAAVAAELLIAFDALILRRQRLSLHEAIGSALGLVSGVALAWVQTAPIAQLMRDLGTVGPLPAPIFHLVAQAHVGLPIERMPSVVHHAINDSRVQRYNPAWQLDRPPRIVPSTVGLKEVMVGYALGSVRVMTPVLVNAAEDRGPRAWPFAVGDELRIGTSATGDASVVYRVLRAEVVNGFRVHHTEVTGPAQRTRIEYIVRKDGGLYRVTPGRNDHDGDLDFSGTPLLIESAPGKCVFDAVPCACSPKLVSCSWTSEGTDAGRVASALLAIVSFGATALFDLPLGKTTRGDLFVLSHTGPGAPKP